MVDFRYHLVSLVSVFLALAVGIILGAGPLQNAIGDTLSNQVESLRESRDEARKNFDAARSELESVDASLEKTGEQLVDKTLTGRRVAILVVPGTSDEDVTEAQESLTMAGATVTGRMDLTDGYADPDKARQRKTVADKVVSSVGAAADAKPDEVISLAVNNILRKGTGDAASTAIVTALTAKNDALVKITDLRQPADAVLVVAPEKLDLGKASKSKTSAVTKVYVEGFKYIASKGPTAAVGGGGSKGAFIISLRETKSGSTVDHVGETQASINTPIAIASEILGGHVHLGTGQNAETDIGTRVDVAVPNSDSGSSDASSNG